MLVLTSGAHRVDTAKVAALLGTRDLKRATAELVRSATGQPIGGVAPVGHPGPLRTLVDVTLAVIPQVWAAGGIPHAVFPTTYDELLRLTGGRPAEVAEPLVGCRVGLRPRSTCRAPRGTPARPDPPGGTASWTSEA